MGSNTEFLKRALLHICIHKAIEFYFQLCYDYFNNDGLISVSTKGVTMTDSLTGSIQEKSGKYYAVINYKDDTGKRKQKWINTKLLVKNNKRKAEKFLARSLEEFRCKIVKEKELPRFSDILVADYFEQWLDKIKLEVEPNTYRSYRGNMNNHIIPYFFENKSKLFDLKAYHLEDYYRFKLSEDSMLNKKGTLSAQTIKHHHQNISKALSDAVKREMIPFNPAHNAKAPKTIKFRSSFLNPSQLKELLAVFEGTTIELPVLLLSIYGLRRSEVLGLTWKNVDFEQKTITIAETVLQHIGGSYERSATKNESSYRTLPLTEIACKVLLAKQERQVNYSALFGNTYFKSDYICTWDDGKVIAPNYLTRTFHKILKSSDLPMVRLHDLRHSVASNLINNKFSVVEVQHWLGHASASTTLNFYAHIDNSGRSDMGKALDKMIFEPSK